MAVKIPLASIAATALLSGTAFAQIHTQTDDRFAPRIYGSTAVTHAQVQAPSSSDVVRVVEPVVPDFQTTILAAPRYSETDVVRAQHFKPGDLSDTEYQALLDEADRIRAYQDNNGYISNSYTNQDSVTYDVGTTTVYSSTNDYEIELFAPNDNVIAPSVTYAETTPISPSYTNGFMSTHRVLRGDTLYNISKRYAVSVESLQSANNISGNNIDIGQVLNIPAGTSITPQSNYVSPVTTVSTSYPITRVRNVEPIPGQSSGIYAVLPKDTLYSISRRACVKVGDLIAVNGIASPNSIKPGERLTMPTGHCLN